MKVIAHRGVCIGVERHLKAGDTADLDPATVQFLKSIGAVSDYTEQAAEAETARETEVASEEAADIDQSNKED